MKNIGLLVLSSAILLASCKKIDASKGKVLDNEVIETGFTGLDLGISGSLVFTEGESTSVIVKTSEKVFDILKIEVDNGILEFDFKNGYTVRNADKIVIEITAPNVNSISISGSGDAAATFDALIEKENVNFDISGSGSLDAKNITANNLIMNVSGSGLITNSNVLATDTKSNISGSGNIEVVGSCSSNDIKISGSGVFVGFDYITDIVDARLSGSGNAQVTANGSLTSEISGSGSLSYRGNPSINSNVTGSGTLIDAN